MLVLHIQKRHKEADSSDVPALSQGKLTAEEVLGFALFLLIEDSYQAYHAIVG